MLRRSILQLPVWRRIPKQIISQTPSFLSSRKDFSTVSPQNAPKGPGSAGKPPEKKSGSSKFVIGSIFIGAAALTAFQTGYLDQFLGQKRNDILTTNIQNEDKKHAGDLEESKVLSQREEHGGLSTNTEHPEQESEIQSHAPHLEVSSNKEDGKLKLVEETSALGGTQETPAPTQENDFSSFSSGSMKSDEHGTSFEPSKGNRLDLNETPTGVGEVLQDINAEVSPSQDLQEGDVPESAPAKGVEAAPPEGLETPTPLLDDYNLRGTSERSTLTSSNGEHKDGHRELFKEKEDSASAVENTGVAHITKDGRLVLDFLQAIHAAENHQAELDAQVFAEEKRKMKEKYEKEIKDARARELMYAEEAAILDKELNKERLKAAASIKSLQEQAEEKLKAELEQKEKEAELELEKVKELVKAELAAAIAREKASQIEKMAEANLNIDALCVAFYARSEEARQTHSVHKIALGALALEDALSKGLPIQKEMEELRSYLDGVDGDALVNLVLSSLPDETRNSGADTILQLNQKFDGLKGPLRHFSLIPPGGHGGVLAHSLAYIASWLKVKEVDHSGEGIESVIKRVENYLVEGKLAEAADALEEGVKDSQAREIIGDWVTRARNRAITEQALTLLQSYAASVSLT